MIRRRLFLLAAHVPLALAFAAPAQTVSALNPPPSREEMDAAIATIPQPADAVPPVEMVGGNPGTAPTFRRADAASPRITRSGVFTVAGSAGLISGTWATALPAGANSYPMFFTGIGSAGSMAIDCIVITSTNTGFTAQCRQQILNLGLLSSPLSILAPAGTQVYGLALPSTQ